MPKTASSERDVDMLDPVIAELEEQRARTQLRGELVFLNDVGGPVDLTNFRDRNWKRFRGAGDRGRTGDVQLGKLAFYH